MSNNKTNVIDTLQLNKPRGIVPPMKNVVGNTYAETRAEIEARQRAEAEAEAALFAAREAANAPVKKSSIWFSVLTVIFLLIALAGTGFGVYEYVRNQSLQDSLDSLEKSFIELRDREDELRHENLELKNQLEALSPADSSSEKTPAESSEESPEKANN
ncbi:hypothetical protein IJH89_00850 [Candidatus Saccharibacteria bacterium]|nr:hypothetical protein [Candidatus Saccharibacteria bacterium]